MLIKCRILRNFLKRVYLLMIKHYINNNLEKLITKLKNLLKYIIY